MRRPGQRLHRGAVALELPAPAPSFDADQTRTALSLPPVRISSESTARRPAQQASRHGVRTPGTGCRPSQRARRRPAQAADLLAFQRAATRATARVDESRRNAIAATARFKTLNRSHKRPAREDVAAPVQATDAPAVPVRRRHHDAAADVVQGDLAARAAHRERRPSGDHASEATASPMPTSQSSFKFDAR